MKTLHPIDVFDIITRGKFPEQCESERKIIDEIYGGGIDWESKLRLDSLNLYISDTSISLFTRVEEINDVKNEIEKLGFKPYEQFYNDSYYNVGFAYTYDDFDLAYKEWNRNKIIEKII
jgi:hypothetical protein